MIKIEENYNVKIGELKIIKKEDDIVWTILGSCVSIIFYVRKDLALICHAQYPSPRTEIHECSAQCNFSCFYNFSDIEKFKYITCSLEYMIAYLKRNKINLNSIHTTLIGGASAYNLKRDQFTFGEKNVLKAREILNKYNIKINREIIGGKEGYTLWYHIKGNKLVYKKHMTEALIEV